MQEPFPLATAILDALGDPALVVRDEHVELANPPARQLLGDQIVGRDIRLAIRHPLALETILENQSTDMELVGIGSADRPWHMSVRPLPDGQLVWLSDRSALRAAEKMRTDFVANASHELRTPLATILGYAETLAEPGQLGEQSRTKFSATIQAEAKKMLAIIEDLMSLSRIEADRFRMPDDQVDLGEVARLAVNQAEAFAERRGCTIACEIAPGLPTVAGDFGQLLQLAENLIGNAIRYGCAGATKRVEVKVGLERSRLVLIVRDQGEGIAATHLPRLTERFYRVDSARSRESGGTGLGLAIVKHIVERHRGTLSIDSTPGEGTSVSVALPTG